MNGVMRAESLQGMVVELHFWGGVCPTQDVTHKAAGLVGQRAALQAEAGDAPAPDSGNVPLPW